MHDQRCWVTLGSLLGTDDYSGNALSGCSLEWKHEGYSFWAVNRYLFCSFEPAICLASIPANALIRTFVSCLTSVINVKSKNWSPPANNGSCLEHDLFIIYTMLKPWSGKVQLFALRVSIVFFTEVSKGSTNISYSCETEWHFSV